jgi:hypothetical protein
MNYQRGVALSGLLLWGFVIVVVAVFGMKVVPTIVEYYKISKDSKAVAEQISQSASVAEVRSAFSRYADVDQLDFKADQLDITKENGKIVISFEYERRIPLFYNVSLVIDYKGTTGNR